MKIRSFVATAALVAVVSLPGAIYAAPAASIHAPVNAFFGKPHTVSMTFRNDSQQPLSLKAGDKEVTIQPGQDSVVKLLAGDKVINEVASANHTAGEVVAVASNDLNDAIIHIK